MRYYLLVLLEAINHCRCIRSLNKEYQQYFYKFNSVLTIIRGAFDVLALKAHRLIVLCIYI